MPVQVISNHFVGYQQIYTHTFSITGDYERDKKSSEGESERVIE